MQATPNLYQIIVGFGTQYPEPHDIGNNLWKKYSSDKEAERGQSIGEA
jgi:hypothetical protein